MKRNRKYNIFSNSEGVTIVEVLIAVYIIVWGLVGVLSLVVQNLQVGYVNKNTLIASQLAQEGLEVIRNKRDKNWLSGVNSYTNIANAGGAITNYSVDMTDVSGTTLVAVGSISNVNASLYICGDGFYKKYSLCTTGKFSGFSRMITTRYISASNLIEVTCLIRWVEKNKPMTYSAKTILYDWN